MNIVETNDPIQTKILSRNPDGTFSLETTWGHRMASLNVYRHLPTELVVNELTLEDIEKMAYDLLKIIQEERK